MHALWWLPTPSRATVTGTHGPNGAALRAGVAYVTDPAAFNTQVPPRVVTTHPRCASAPAAYKLDARSRRALNKLGVDWSGASAKNPAALEELVATNSP